MPSRRSDTHSLGIGIAESPDASSKHDLDRGTAKALLLVTLLIAAALRLFGANDQLWFDEIATLLDSVRKPLGVIMTHFPSDNDHVFYSALAHISVGLGGETPLMLRLPAILFGIASIPLIYTIGTRITTRFEALASAIVATVSAYHIWFSQNARGYTMLLALTLIGTQFIFDGLKTRSIKPWLGFALASALGAYTHLSMVLAIVGQATAVATYVLTSQRFRFEEMKGPAVGFIGAAVLTMLLYLPMIGDITGFFGATAAAPKPAAAGGGLFDLLSYLRLSFLSGMILVVGSVIFLVGLISYWRQSSLILTLFFIPAALIFFATVLMERPTRPRFFFFVAGFLILVGIRGAFVIIHFLLELGRKPWLSYEKPVRWLAIAALTSILLVDLSHTYNKPKMDYEGALAYVEAARRPDDVVALAGVGATFVYTEFYHRDWPRISSVDQLASLRHGHDVLVIRTLERTFNQSNPALLEALKASCSDERNFPGTLQDGNVHISRCERQK